MLDLSSVKKISDAKHYSCDIDQLYHPTGVFEQDSEDLVYSSDNLNTTKFIPILLKEWFFLVKKDGYLVIDYQPNKICDWQRLEEYMWWLWKGKYEIIYHGPVKEEHIVNLSQSKLNGFVEYYKNHYKNNLDERTLLPKSLLTETNIKSSNERLRFICGKKEATSIRGDSIGKWTFGIITNGVKLDWIESIISSIRKQGIPECEIIVCGTYFDRKEPDFIYMPFNQRDDKKWITKKKNLIIDSARYNNVCILHDRMYLSDNWYDDIKKWGNCFEAMSCVRLFEGNLSRLNNWYCIKGFEMKKAKSFRPLLNTGNLDYKDWDKDVICGGGFDTVKKHVFQNILLNETVYWAEYEDIIFDQNLYKLGYVLRAHNQATIFSRTISAFGFNAFFDFNKIKLGKLKSLHFLYFILFPLLDFFGFNTQSPSLSYIKKNFLKLMNIQTHDNRR